MTLPNDIQEAIRKSLPQQVAAELRDYVEQAERDKQAFFAAQATIKAFQDETNKLRGEVAELQSLRNREASIVAGERKLAQMEVELKHQRDLNTIITTSESNQKNNMLEVLKIVFKSQPVGHAFSKSVSTNVNEPSTPQNNYQPLNKYINTTETQTVKEVTE